MIITAPVRRTIITIMIITTAGITGRTGRVPSPAPHYVTANQASYPRLYQLM